MSNITDIHSGAFRARIVHMEVGGDEWHQVTLGRTDGGAIPHTSPRFGTRFCEAGHAAAVKMAHRMIRAEGGAA